MFNLTDHELTAQEVFTRIDRGRVISVIVEKVEGNMILAKVGNELSINVDLAKTINRLDLFDRNRNLFFSQISGWFALIILLVAVCLFPIRFDQKEGVLLSFQSTT